MNKYRKVFLKKTTLILNSPMLASRRVHLTRINSFFKQKLNVLQKQKEQKDSIRMICIEKQIKIRENIMSGITIQEALVILSMEKYESMIFPTGAINFTGTATVSGFEMVVEKGIVKSKKVIPEDLGTGNFATSTMLDKIEIR